MAIDKKDLSKIKELMLEVIAPINFRLDKIDQKLDVNDQNWQKQWYFNEKMMEFKTSQENFNEKMMEFKASQENFNEKMMEFKASQENFNKTVDARLTRLERKSKQGKNNARQKSPFSLKGIAGTLIKNDIVSAQELLDSQEEYHEFDKNDFVKLGV